MHNTWYCCDFSILLSVFCIFYTVNLQVEKYLVARCIFCDPKDVLCAAMLLYHFRIFERRFGSAKFVVSIPEFIIDWVEDFFVDCIVEDNYSIIEANFYFLYAFKSRKYSIFTDIIFFLCALFYQHCLQHIKYIQVINMLILIEFWRIFLIFAFSDNTDFCSAVVSTVQL